MDLFAGIEDEITLCPLNFELKSMKCATNNSLCNLYRNKNVSKFLCATCMYVTVNIDFTVQIDPMILLVVLVRLNLNQPMECLWDQSKLQININYVITCTRNAVSSLWVSDTSPASVLVNRLSFVSVPRSRLYIDPSWRSLPNFS